MKRKLLHLLVRIRNSYASRERQQRRRMAKWQLTMKDQSQEEYFLDAAMNECQAMEDDLEDQLNHMYVLKTLYCHTKLPSDESLASSGWSSGFFDDDLEERDMSLISSECMEDNVQRTSPQLLKDQNHVAVKLTKVKRELEGVLIDIELCTRKYFKDYYAVRYLPEKWQWKYSKTV